MASSTGMKDQMSARSQPIQLSVRCSGMVVITEFIRRNPYAFATHGNSTKFSQTSISIQKQDFSKIWWANKKQTQHWKTNENYTAKVYKTALVRLGKNQTARQMNNPSS